MLVCSDGPLVKCMRLKNYAYLTTVPAMLLLLICLIGWNVSSKAGETNLSTGTSGVSASPSEVIVVSSRTVDSDGADMAVGNIGSPVDGLIVRIPPRSMAHADRLTLGYSMRSVAVRAGKPCGIVVTLRADTILRFDGLVTVEVHYRESPPPTLAIPYSIDVKGRLHVMNVQTFEAASKTLVFYTSTPGDYTWVYE